MVMDKISAFMDGEAAPAETQVTIRQLRQDQSCREAWNCFHLVGDVIRGEPVLADDFLVRLREKMEGEPVPLAPRRHWRRTAEFAYAAAAGIAGVAVVLALVMTDNPLRPSAEIASAAKTNPQIASADPHQRLQPVASANSTQVNEYLMAHQEFSPRTALQGVVPYVRSVSATHDGNRR